MAASIAAALAAAGAGLYLASHHPLWPAGATAVFVVWTAIAARWRGLWLLVLPAALPLLNFSPWTGWLAFDEFDLLVLGTLAGGLARFAFEPVEIQGAATPASGTARAGALMALAFAGLGLLSLMRGLTQADVASFDWFDGYADALNSVRVSKSVIFAAALWPLLSAEFRCSPARSIRRLALGMQLGLAFVGLAVLWERIAYPGLLDFSTRYRATAAFWEMHVGGAAIDAYLALAMPFAAWALWSARSRRGFAAAALVALLAAHAGLTTFSRGAYAGMFLPLLLLGVAWWMRRLRIEPRTAALAAVVATSLACGVAALLLGAFLAMGFAGTALALFSSLLLILAVAWRVPWLHWRRAAAMALAVALIAEGVAVIGGGAFMRSRLEASESDLAARLAHWRRGIELVRDPADGLFGIGAGRLPYRYSSEAPGGEFSGTLTLDVTESGTRAARLSGPSAKADLAGLFALTQRVSLHPGTAYRASLRVRVPTSTDVAVALCEQHLLFPRRCQATSFRVVPSDGAWQWLNGSLRGPRLSTGSWYAPRHGVFSVTVGRAGTRVDIADASLRAPDGSELLENRDFAAGLAHWFPIARRHYLPWHIDNLYLELLIERGALGLATFLLVTACAFRNLLMASDDRESGIAPFLAASLAGALLVGMVSSILDVPRVAFLGLLLTAVSLQPALRSPYRRDGDA